MKVSISCLNTFILGCGSSLAVDRPDRPVAVTGKGEIMRKGIMGLAAGIFCLCFFVFPGYAQGIYVTGITKITLRSGPGVDNKILAMLTSGTKLEIVQRGDDWSQVRTERGKSGWVLTRFLTEELPLSQVVIRLEKKNKKLIEELEALRTEHKTMREDNLRLAGIENAYKNLSADSADFLKLSGDYKLLVQECQDQKKTIASLKENQKNDTRFWFLSGAGVFLVGVLLGLSTRPGKRNSLGL